MPDNRFSLFEGLSGSMCAWADACAVIQVRIRSIELKHAGKNIAAIEQDEEIQCRLQHQLGVPGFGYGMPC
jgi:hypothetical protein